LGAFNLANMRKPNIRNIDELSELKDYVDSLDPNTITYVDTETTSLDVYSAEAWIISVYQPGNDAVSIFPQSVFFEGIPMISIIKVLNPVLENFPIAGQNFKFDWCILIGQGFTKKINFVHDSIILMHLYDPDQPLKMETRVYEDLGIHKESFEEMVGNKWATILRNFKKLQDSGKITKENSGLYAAEDVWYTHLLFEHYHPLLLADKKLYNIYENVEIPLIECLVEAQVTGIRIDKQELVNSANLIQEELTELEQKIYDEAGCEFNINSPAQKGKVLFEVMGLPNKGRTKSGQYATDEKVIKSLGSQGHKIAEHLLTYSEYSKALSTYALGIQKLIDSDGRLRGNLNSTGTSTLRFSSSNPNLQNLSSDDKFRIRHAFVPTKGGRLIMCDFDAQEYAIAAHASRDENMLAVFERREDIHQWVADMCDITRKDAKAVGFGIFYGLSISNLASLLRVSVAVAESYIKKYYNAFPKLLPWKNAVEAFAIRNKYIRTPMGAIRRFPDIDNKKFRNACLRRAVNTSIQGSAAIQVKMAMVKIFREIKKRNLSATVVLSVHDELGVDVTNLDHVEEVCKVVQFNMENAIEMRSKFSAKPNVVNSYGEGKDDSNNQRHLFKNRVNPFKINYILHANKKDFRQKINL